VDATQAIDDFGALLFLAGGGITALVYIARRYEARLLSENEFLLSANAAFAKGMERLAEEIEPLREEIKPLHAEVKRLNAAIDVLREEIRPSRAGKG
jgi:predicted nuclease with TOPRIM domain